MVQITKSRVGAQVIIAGRVALAIVALVLCSGQDKSNLRAQSAAVGQKSGEQKACVTAAREKLGPDAAVLRCGHLSDSGALETLAVVKLASIAGQGNCVAVSRLAVLRHDGTEWKAELEADQQIKNPEGYIGLSYIDDSYKVRGYCLTVTDRRTGSREPFSIALGYITKNGRFEGVPVYIGWNSKVGRYQEFAGNDDAAGFNSEVKHPRHVNTAKECCGK
jgi:hypothetical protein